MITVQEAKTIAGRMLIEKFGLDFVLLNKNKLGTSVECSDGSIKIYFDLSEKPIDQYSNLFNMDGEEQSPNIIYAVLIDSKDERATVINLN